MNVEVGSEYVFFCQATKRDPVTVKVTAIEGNVADVIIVDDPKRKAVGNTFSCLAHELRPTK